MIPVSLNLRNFMSYTDAHEPLRFDGIHVAVLSGDNGHGKSALLDAITWSLWGQSRARSVDDLIHTGTTEMEVEFEFILDGQQYRVIRKRQRKGKTGLSDLQFAVLANGRYRPLTERSLLETEKAIRRTLKMSYETFTNSSFIQQGRADSFTTNQPAERKRILAEILELGYYDDLEERAKEALRQRQALLNEERTRVKEFEQELARRPEYQAKADELRQQLDAVEEEARQLDATCGVARERLARLETLRRQLDEAQARLTRLAGERTTVETQLTEVRARLARARDVLDRAETIEAAAAEHATVRADLEAANTRLQQYLPLSEALQRAEREIAAERARLEGEQAQLARQAADFRQRAAPRADLEQQQERLSERVERLQRTEAERDALQRTAVTCREEAAEKRTINAQLKEQMHDLRSQMESLASLETCPSCQRPMDASHKRKLSAVYEAQGKDLKARFRENEQQYRQLEKRVADDDLRLAELNAALAERDACQKQLTEVVGQLRQAVEAEERLGAAERRLAELQQALGAEDYAADARRCRGDAQRQIAALAYDAEAHRALQARQTALADAEAQKKLLDQARLATELLGARQAEHEARLTALAEECVQEERRCQELRTESADFETQRASLEQMRTTLQQKQVERDRLRDALSQINQQLTYCEYLEKRVVESVTRQDGLMREQGIFAELAHAFGKKGIQAMMIETAIPEIEEEANRLLARMTDGRMHVKFDTQRDKRDGGVIETLDIRISDELGTRSYEMFSGGESFRVNFAIRIALSKLLARRAGTKLQTLVVDEGFGSQDQEGRDRIVEAIQAIQDEFEKILVVTHLEDLRDRFPVRIEIRKTPAGSTILLR